MIRRAAPALFAAALLGAQAATAEPASKRGVGAGAPAPSGAACAAGGRAMRSTTLFFGLKIPGGGAVSDAQWTAFLDRVVTPRFPGGLSVFEARGQWRDAKTGRIVREPSRALQLWYAPGKRANRDVEAIRAAYKARFRQDSVMRVDDLDCVSF